MENTEDLKRDPDYYCGRCTYWRRHDSRYGNCVADGECRKNAPRSVLRPSTNDEEFIETVWPCTYGEDWCGEWKKDDRS